MRRLNALSPGNAGQTQSRGGHFELKSGGDIRARLKKKSPAYGDIFLFSAAERSNEARVDGDDSYLHCTFNRYSTAHKSSFVSFNR